jgi:hypothetical protein
MPLDLSDLKAKKRTVIVDYEGESIKVDYRPQMINPEYQTFLKRLKDDQATDDEAEQWESVLRVVCGWDIVDDGKPVQITRENLAILPTSLLLTIMEAVMEDASPNRKSGGLSAAGSRPRAS